MFEIMSDTDSETDTYIDIIDIDSYTDPYLDPDIKTIVCDKIRENIPFIIFVLSVSAFSVISYFAFTYNWRI